MANKNADTMPFIFKLKKELNNNKKTHLGFMTVYLIAAICIFSLPDKFLATGSLLIQRTAEKATTYFTYEGFYSQQSAQLYTNTVVGLLESEDMRAQAMEKLGIPVNEISLRKYGRYIRVSKAGPQLIEFTVKGNNPEEARNLWNVLANEVINKNSEINNSGDNNLKIVQVYQIPLVNKAYKSLLIDLTAAALFSIATSLIYISYKDYE